MTRGAGLALAVAAVAVVTPMPAGALPVRTTSVPYTGTAGLSGVGSAGWRTTSHRVGEAAAGVRPGERVVDVRVTDDSALAVPFSLYEETNDDGTVSTFLGFHCGRTPDPVVVSRHAQRVRVFLLAGQCGAGAGAATTGTVAFRLA